MWKRWRVARLVFRPFQKYRRLQWRCKRQQRVLCKKLISVGRWTCMQWYDLNNLEWIVGLFLNGSTILKIEWLVGLLFAFFLSIMQRERMNISNSYSPTSVTIGASYTFGATIGSKQGSGSNSNYHQPFVAEKGSKRPESYTPCLLYTSPSPRD